MKLNWVQKFSFSVLMSGPAFCMSSVLAGDPTRAIQLKNLEALSSNYNKILNEFLLPTSEDISQGARTLGENISAKQGGVVRILPRDLYDDGGAHPLRLVRGGGAYYSFEKLTHEYGNGSDIELSNRRLSVGFAGCDFGLIFDLGEIDLEKVSLDTNEAKILNGIEVAKTEPEIRKQQHKAYNWNQDGILFSDRAGVAVGHTYLLRSVNFDTSDLLVAFKVLRIDDEDESMIFVWKKLNSYPTPSCR